MQHPAPKPLGDACLSDVTDHAGAEVAQQLWSAACSAPHLDHETPGPLDPAAAAELCQALSRRVQHLSSTTLAAGAAASGNDQDAQPGPAAGNASAGWQTSAQVCLVAATVAQGLQAASAVHPGGPLPVATDLTGKLANLGVSASEHAGTRPQH